MIHRRKCMRFAKLLWITRTPPKWVGFYLINTTLTSVEACISSRITTGIQVVRDYQINYNWYNEPFAVSSVKFLYLDMHGLIFETSVWLLAESTRLLSSIVLLSNKSTTTERHKHQTHRCVCFVFPAYSSCPRFAVQNNLQMRLNTSTRCLLHQPSNSSVSSSNIPWVPRHTNPAQTSMYCIHELPVQLVTQTGQCFTCLLFSPRVHSGYETPSELSVQFTWLYHFA